MKREGWRIGKPWEWETGHEVYVYGLEGVTERDVELVVTIINDVIREFTLPLSVFDGDSVKSKDVSLVEELISECLEEKRVDLDRFEAKLNEIRESGLLPYGLVILVDYNRYKLKRPVGSEKEPYYGYGTSDGIIVLRRFDIRNAVKHEFGHMIGLGVHHENCVMAYSCLHGEFCEDCKRKIQGMWGV